MFDGPGASAIGAIMARMNKDAEVEAVARLDPKPADAVLVIGFGPGVGLKALTPRLSEGMAFAVDPSRAMHAQALRRNREAAAQGRLRFHLGVPDSLPVSDATFNGVIAVNSLQLCEPIAPTAAELARVVSPGGRFISLTHDWAAAKHAGSVAAWEAGIETAFRNAGWSQVLCSRGRSEGGKSILFDMTR